MKTEGMIIGDLDNIDAFSKYGELIMAALKWAAAHRNDPFVAGTTRIAGDKVAVNAQEVTLAPATRLEAHRKFIDIHVPLSGPETLGWANVPDLADITVPYNPDKDVMFYGEAPVQTARLIPGQFVIFYPADAHAPNMGRPGKHHKLCIKIPVE